MAGGAGMFGSPIGDMNFDDNLRDNLKTAASIPLTEAHTRLFNAEANEKEAKVRELLQMQGIGRDVAARFSQGGQQQPGGPQQVGPQAFSQSQYFDEVARGLADKGFVLQAQKVAKDAGEMRRAEATALSAQTTAKLNQLKVVGERAEMLGQIFGGAKDEQEWQKAGAMYEFTTGQPSPFAGVPFSPELPTQLRDQAVTIKDRLAAEDRRLTREERERHNDATESAKRTENNIRQQRADQQDRHQRVLEKNGGAGGRGAAGAPSPEELRQTSNLLKLEGIDVNGVDKASQDSLRFEIASRAREMQFENKALGRSQALRAAFDEFKKSGLLEVEKTEGTGWFGTGGKTQFKREKSEAGDQLPPAAQKQLREGYMTTFNNGQQWTLENGKAKRVK